jgi:hypothetical protein
MLLCVLVLERGVTGSAAGRTRTFICQPLSPPARTILPPARQNKKQKIKALILYRRRPPPPPFVRAIESSFGRVLRVDFAVLHKVVAPIAHLVTVRTPERYTAPREKRISVRKRASTYQRENMASCQRVLTTVIGVQRQHVSLEMLPPPETLAAPLDLAHKHACGELLVLHGFPRR